MIIACTGRTLPRMRVLGIDPGLRITGYGCIDAAHSPPRLVEAGIFRLCATDDADDAPAGVLADARASRSAASLSRRLAELDTDFRALIERLGPQVIAVESLFAHYKHPATAIVMGHARGVLLLAVRRAGVPLVELKPNAVKKAVTGFGHASKEQMQRAVQACFSLPEPPSPPDVADALAVALCAAARAGASAL
jgi:crossover junction endodeoxyribonuclease RuvC